SSWSPISAMRGMAAASRFPVGEIVDHLGGPLFTDHARIDFQLRRAVAAAEDDVVTLHHFAIDPDRHVGGQCQRRHAADLHARQLAGLLGRGERDAAGAQLLAHHAVDVEAMGGEQDAGSVLALAGLGLDENGVRGLLRGHAVVRAEHRGIGEIGIARPDLERVVAALEQFQNPGQRIRHLVDPALFNRARLYAAARTDGFAAKESVEYARYKGIDLSNFDDYSRAHDQPGSRTRPRLSCSLRPHAPRRARAADPGPRGRQRAGAAVRHGAAVLHPAPRRAGEEWTGDLAQARPRAHLPPGTEDAESGGTLDGQAALSVADPPRPTRPIPHRRQGD